MKKDNLIYLNNEQIKMNEEPKKKVNVSRLIGVAIVGVLIISAIIAYAVYANNESARKYIDEHILEKNVNENNLNKIEIAEYDKSNFFACQDKIIILNGTTLTTYNTSGKKEKQENVDISEPVSAINNEYFVLAEKNGNKVYMIKNGSKFWEKEIEGKISKVSVNEVGYTAVIITGTTYKTVIELFDPDGNELFKNYLSNTIVADVTISKDCKYLAYGELNTSGTVIQSNIKIIDIQKAKDKQEEAIAYTYKADSNKLIVNLEYQNNNRLVCVYDDEICVIKDNSNEEILKYGKEGNSITFVSAKLDSYCVAMEEVASGMFSTTSKTRIINTSNNKESIYNFSGVTKEIYSVGNKIAINLGTEIHFVDTNGWLIKKYVSSQEAKNIVISKDIAGIIYRDKIEIVKL